MTPQHFILLLKISANLTDALRYQALGDVEESDKHRRKAERLILKLSGETK